MDKSSERPSQTPTRAMREVTGDDLEALIRYAHFAPSDEALAIARELLSNGAWMHATSSIRGLLDNKLASHSAWAALANELLQVLADDQRGLGDVRAAAHDLVELLGRRGTADVRARLVSWLLDVAGPSEARVVIRLVLTALDRSDGETHASLGAWCRPLTCWLVDRGGGELARGADPLVMLHVIETCRAWFPDRLFGALKILERSDKPDAVFTVDGAGDRILHPAVETALERGLPVEWVDQAFGGALAALNALGYDRFFAPFEPDNGMPLLRAALLSSLARGRWRSGVGMEVWERAFMHMPPDALVFDDEGFETALHALIWARHDESIDADSLTAWTTLIAIEWFKRFGLHRPTANAVPGVWSLDILAAEPRLSAGVARAFLLALNTAPASATELGPAREVMSRAEHEPHLASVALLLLPGASVEAESSTEALVDVGDLLSSIVRANWSSPIAGVDVKALFQGTCEVIITERGALNPEVLIEFRSNTVLTGDVGAYRRIVREVSKTGTRQDVLAVCALYFVHEVVHVLQGMQRKSSVTAMRATGSEHALAHLDLEADDLAARIASAATNWSLSLLKDVAGRGVLAFPASMHHTNASVTRKSVRLVSLRMDYLLRERAYFGIEPDADGYASVELPFSTGQMLVMWNGRHRKLIAAVPLHEGEVDKLTRVARDGVELEKLDELLMQILDRAHPLDR